MLLVFISSICLISAIILELIIVRKYGCVDYRSVLPILLVSSLMLSAFMFAAISITECTSVDRKTRNFNNAYSTASALIRGYDETTDIETLHDLYERCRRIDSMADRHRKLCHSRWRGHGYSEEIGNTPSLVKVFDEKFYTDKILIRCDDR